MSTKPLHRVVLLAATVTAGLMAGTFFAFSVAVMPGLAASSDATFVQAMNHINVAIENPVFFLAFFGAIVLPAVAAWQQHKAGAPLVARWAAAGLACYLVAFAMTVGVNIPLNNALASGAHDPHAARAAFEQPWNAGNTVRTIASAAALGCLAWASRVARRVTRQPIAN